MNKEKSPNQLQKRSFQFSLKIIGFLEKLPRNYIYQTIGKQLLRSATSIGANIAEAQAGRTRKDFTNYYHIALKSANETTYWLRLLKSKLTSKNYQKLISNLSSELTEICKMLTASLKTLKRRSN